METIKRSVVPGIGKGKEMNTQSIQDFQGSKDTFYGIRAWWATVHEVTKGWTQMNDFHFNDGYMLPYMYPKPWNVQHQESTLRQTIDFW